MRLETPSLEPQKSLHLKEVVIHINLKLLKKLKSAFLTSAYEFEQLP